MLVFSRSVCAMQHIGRSRPSAGRALCKGRTVSRTHGGCPSSHRVAFWPPRSSDLRDDRGPRCSLAAAAACRRPPLPCSNTAAAPLFTPYTLPGGVQLQHRIVYAPLTRCRAFNNIPQARWGLAGQLGRNVLLPLSLQPLAALDRRLPAADLSCVRCPRCSPMPRCTTASVLPPAA